MLLKSLLRASRWAAWATILISLPVRADTSSMAADVARLTATVWAPAAAYGLALIAAFNKRQK